MQCDAQLTINGEVHQCEEEADHWGSSHTAMSKRASWGPDLIPPLQRLAPYAVWSDALLDDDIANIIRGRE